MFRNKTTSKRFVLARSSDQTDLALVKRQYQRNIEKALVISLVFAIVVIRLLSTIHIDKLLIREDQINFETIDIVDIPPLVEEQPKLKMEEVVEIPPDEEAENEVESAIEEMLEEETDMPELALASSSPDDFLISSSQLGAVTGPELNFRKTRGDIAGDIQLRKSKFYGDGADGGLDIGKAERTSRTVSEENDGLNLKTKPVELTKAEPETRSKPEPKLGLPGPGEKIISFASSTFGTEDYKIWNKINAELDRLNKGRYGSVPKEITRVKGGFIIRFGFPDGTRQEMHWENAGNVWIKITGNSSRSSAQELRRALDALLKINLGS